VIVTGVSAGRGRDHRVIFRMNLWDSPKIVKVSVMSLTVGQQLCQRESLAADTEVVGSRVTGPVLPRVTSCSQESAAARIACSPGALVTSGSWRTTSP
jgi:hypothetical protein